MTTNRPLPDSPLVVSYGGGVDSTAVLVGFKRQGIRPDLIIFSDTGAERPETYAALAIMDTWLESVGFPKVTRTHFNVVTARYDTLEGNCLQNDVLPSLSYGGHSCSLKWKIESIDDHVWGVRGWQPALDALHDGKQVVRVIGYDDSKADRKRFAKMDGRSKSADAKGDWSPWSNWYPLQDWGWTRPECIAAIEAEPKLAGLFQAELGQCHPIKSACFFCPACKRDEVKELAREHPDLALRAVVMEYRAETGKHGLRTINGLGLGREDGMPKGTRNWSWRRLLLDAGLLPEDWKARATAAGLLPDTWDDYAAECTARRAALEAATGREAAALACLPESTRAAITAAKAPALKKLVAIQKQAGPVGREWVAALAERMRIEAEKKAVLSPDWTARPLRVADPVAKRLRAEKRKAWRAAVAKAKKGGGK